MRTLKLVIWIAVLYILQTVFYPALSLTGIIPDLLMAFASVYAVTEHRYKIISRVIIICAILSATGTGRVFPIAVLMSGLCAVCAYLSSGYLHFVAKAVKVICITFMFAFVSCLCEYFVFAKTVSVYTALHIGLYQAIVTAIIYFILNKVINDTDKKILLVQGRE